MDIKQSWTNFKAFIGECRRVLRVTRKPTKEELKTIVKASALGMLIIGGLGFVISMLAQIIIPQ